MIVFLTQGQELALDYLVNAGSPQDLVLRLFQNDVTDGLTEQQQKELTEADFTEADFTGYAAETLSGGSWTTTNDDPAVASHAQQDFVSSANQTPQTIYGYFYTRASGGEAIAFEVFDAPVDIEFLDDAVQVTPRITATDQD